MFKRIKRCQKHVWIAGHDWYANLSIALAGASPPTITPDKLEQPSKQNLHRLRKCTDGFDCVSCGAFAVDVGDLKAVPCVRSSDIKSLEAERKRLEQLQQLQTLQHELHGLLETKRFLESSTSSSSLSPHLRYKSVLAALHTRLDTPSYA